MIEILPSADYASKLDATDPAGKRHEVMQSDDIAVPKGATSLTVSCARADLPDTADAVIKCRAEISLDGGKTWRLAVGMTTAGGKAYSAISPIEPRPAELLTQDFCSSALPEPDNPNRLLRVQVIPFRDVKTRVDLSFGADA